MDPDLKTFAESIEKGLAGVGTTIEAQLAEFNETAKKVLVIKPEATPEAAAVTIVEKSPEKAELEASAVGGITNMEVWDIPLGQALVGGFVAVFASELVDGFLASQGGTTKAIVKLVGAGVAVKWGSRFLGSTGAKAVAILLAYDGLRMLLPIDEWANRAATGVSGIMPGAGLAGKAGQERTAITNPTNSGVSQDYYAAAFGRS